MPAPQTIVRKAGSVADPLWYKDAVIYEMHVKAFSDSNNDGIGDFPGLMQKLDYLQDLGVTCLWLLPFFPSPLRDDGYDISDYMSVHPSYGTLDDFQRFLDAAHDRGLQVMIELVINHTSDQHPWFQRARQRASRIDRTQLLRLERHRSEVQRRAHHLHRHRKIQLDLGSRRPGLLLASLLLAPAGSELRQSRGAGRSPPRDALLARHGRGRAAHRRHSVSGRARRHQLRESSRNPRRHQSHPRGDR